MRLALNVGYDGSDVVDRTDLVQEAEKLGYHSVWAAEAYGADVVTALSWYAARTERINVGAGIMQIPGRTPAMTAMTAVGLSELSGGRFLLGLGASGPQVAEGWHGQPYAKPLGRTREYISLVRQMLAREERVSFDGEHYQLPYQGAGSTGLGRPLRMITHPSHNVPIYLAASGPKNVALAAEIADGWLPIFWSPFRAPDAYRPMLDAGFAASGDDTKRDRFDVVASVATVLTDAPEQALWAIKPTLALYIGGMGARGKNFYHDLACRYGYEAEANQIQDLYLEGKKQEAIAAVPDQLADEVSLVGPAGHIAERLEAWKESGVTTVSLMTSDLGTMRTVAEILS
ncbi:MAG: LLM class F420-dependent oxidoreductase [Acidimicrobiia bacterium]|nr:LLM class F420-dependent oxidoreductase [Acidimicrobiia bacterium]NNF62899.1 LLM class F420-dependent oxidoreductase [Acidimicrobiia bacterium]